jgi:formylglycine-generating enzyme required for sulfatase activity
VLQADVASDAKGFFVRRSAAGLGNITQETITITLGSAIGGDNIGVYGVEMVNVPEGEFYIGDGNTADPITRRFTAGNTNNPLLITAAIQAAGIGVAVNYQKANFGSTGSLPATFPVGFNRFYSMKYEITTAQYVSFLNTLTYNQQLRLQENQNATPPSAPIGTPMHRRLGINIEIVVPGISNINLTPAVYGNDATNDNVFNQTNDGLGLPVSTPIKNFLAYLDWAALRPMTEFEYEKACRGPIAPVLNELPWGTTDFSVPGRTLSFTPNEALTSQVLGANNWNTATFSRVGIAATATSDRIYAGATYYGILDMGFSAHERCVGGWGYNYATFTTVNGDGLIDQEGFANVPTWPAPIESYYSKRGGSMRDLQGMNISNREFAAHWDTNVDARAYGGRGVRSF